MASASTSASTVHSKLGGIGTPSLYGWGKEKRIPLKKNKSKLDSFFYDERDINFHIESLDSKLLN
jgi:hypothetical protein